MIHQPIMRRLAWAAVVLSGFASMQSAGADLAVIANPSMKLTEISAGELRDVFLGTKTALRDAGQVQPVLKKAGPELTEFSTAYLGKTPSALLTYYRSLVFTGRWSMPVSLTSDEEVIAYVARTKGAIGFVHTAAAASSSVKTLKVK